MTIRIVLLIPLGFFQGLEDNAPRIVEKTGKYSLQLPSQIQATLKGYDSTFICWQFDEYDEFTQQSYQVNHHQLPYAIVGDFNGDGKQDVILDGHNHVNRVILAVLSSNEAFGIIELGQFAYISPTNEQSWLQFIPKGTMVQAFESESIELKADAFEWVSAKGSSVWHFDNGRFSEVVTGD